MATLYVGDLWYNKAHEVVACGRPDKYSNHKEFIVDVECWLIERKIDHKMTGDWMHRSDESGSSCYYYCVTIPNEHDRTMFKLRWA